MTAITNAFNLLDNMDGLSGGVAAVAALFFLVLGAGFFLDGYRLLLSGNSTFQAAGYADVNARLFRQGWYLGCRSSAR